MAADPSSSSSNRESEQTSYVKMTEVDRSRYADATLIGQHCEAEYCNQLDFLPFYCQSCEKTFCLDHRTEGAHKCANAGAWAERKRQAELSKLSIGASRPLQDRVTEKPCSSADCKTTIGTSLVPGVHCDRCNRDYCLKHRLREDHDCANLTPIGARVPDKVTSALGNLRSMWASQKQRMQEAKQKLPKPKPTAAARQRISVAELKKTAKGDDKLAVEKRIYLHVEAEAATVNAKVPKGEFFYSKDWVIGRVLDAAARSLQIENINNQSNKEEDKLRIFHVEGGRVLEFNEKVGTVLATGNTIVLLRGVGPSTPDLIEA